MKKSLLSALPLCFALVACNNSSSTPKSDAVVIPKSLNWSPSPKSAPLTKDQANEIKKTFAVKSMMILPPGELVFPDKNMSKWEREQKERQLAQQDPNSYQLLQDLRAGCAKGHPTVAFNATFPSDQVTADNAFDILKVGDMYSMSASAALTGANCPVDLAGSYAMNAELKGVDSEDRSGSAAAGTGMKLNAVMKNPKYANLLGTRGMIVDTSLSGLVIRRELQKGARDNASVNFNLAGTYLSLKADIPYSTEIKALIKSAGANEATSEVAGKTELIFPTFTAVLDVHADVVNEKTMNIQYYLNGNVISQSELEELFGTNTPNALLQTKQVTELLMN